jgi:sulfane dehydrogenase subunit SoxC
MSEQQSFENLEVSTQPRGRLQRAPEHFLSPEQIVEVQRGRRDILRGAFMSAAAASLAGAGLARASTPAGDPNILELPAHSKGLGQAVATTGYGQPSQYEKNLQRRESPGLTRVSAASVSFAPLQGFFGIITPNGLHF